MYILGIDIGSKKTGICLYNATTKQVIKRAKIWDIKEVLELLENWELSHFNNVAVVIEQISGGSEQSFTNTGFIIYKIQNYINKSINTFRTVNSSEWQRTMFRELKHLDIDAKQKAKRVAQMYLADLTNWSKDEIDAFLLCKWYEYIFIGD